MALGLARLQMDAGLREEARATLASLQGDFQLLLHGLESPMEILAEMARMDRVVVERRRGFGQENHLAGEPAAVQGSVLGWSLIGRQIGPAIV
jgi:hypothetical protein